MADAIAVAIIVLIVGAASRYIYKQKKNGAKCIGCSCGSDNCHCSETKK